MNSVGQLFRDGGRSRSQLVHILLEIFSIADAVEVVNVLLLELVDDALRNQRLAQVAALERRQLVQVPLELPYLAVQVLRLAQRVQVCLLIRLSLILLLSIVAPSAELRCLCELLLIT